jgi:hypothetical protein
MERLKTTSFVPVRRRVSRSSFQESSETYVLLSLLVSGPLDSLLLLAFVVLTPFPSLLPLLLLQPSSSLTPSDHPILYAKTQTHALVKEVGIPAILVFNGPFPDYVLRPFVLFSSFFSPRPRHLTFPLAELSWL